MLSNTIVKKTAIDLKKIWLEIICFLLILLFSYAGLSKLFSIDNFKFQLGRSPFVTHFSGFIAWFLPSAEIIIAVLLAVGKTRHFGLHVSFFMMLLFTGYIYAMLHYSYYIPCSCGGVLSVMSWNQHFIFNIFFSMLALTGIVLQAKKTSNGN